MPHRLGLESHTPQASARIICHTGLNGVWVLVEGSKSRVESEVEGEVKGRNLFEFLNEHTKL